MKTSRVCMMGIALVMVSGLLAPGKTAIAKTAPKKTAGAKALPISALEGSWKVVSSSWGGDPEAFSDVIYELKIKKDSISGKPGEATQFVATINGGGGIVSGINGKTPFCAQRYTEKPNSYSFYLGYPYLLFWRPADYPCGDTEDSAETDSSVTGPNIGVPVARYLIRFDLVSASRAHAIIYYELSGYGVATEEHMAALEKNMFDMNPNKPKAKCASGLCFNGATAWTGLFELELVKQGKR